MDTAAVRLQRTVDAQRVERAQMLLAYRETPSFFAVGQKVGVHHQTVERCVERALAYGPLAALDDRPRPGAELFGVLVECPKTQNVSRLSRCNSERRVHDGTELAGSFQRSTEPVEAQVQRFLHLA